MSAPDDPPGGKMHFARMDGSTDADSEVLEEVHVRNLAALPDLLLGMLTDLDGDANYPIDRLQHSLQTATRALDAVPPPAVPDVLLRPAPRPRPQRT